MILGKGQSLRLLARIVLLLGTAAIYCGAANAQDPDNPMGLPPRTSTPPPSVQTPEQTGQQSGDQSGQSITPESSEDQGRFVFKKQVQEVVLHATVVDESGRLITSLDRSAFTVSQNGRAEDRLPLSGERMYRSRLGLLSTTRAPCGTNAEQGESGGLLNLVHASNPQDQVFVVNFSQTPYLDQDFTSDVNLLQTALHQVSSRGSTALYDAVVASDVHLRNNPQSRQESPVSDHRRARQYEPRDSARRHA